MKTLYNIIEGILDDDDLDTKVEKSASEEIFVDILAPVFAGKSALTDAQAQQIKGIIEILNKTEVNLSSVARRLRQKDNTAIIYFEKHPKLKCEVIEVRAFVKNPLPYVAQIVKEYDRWMVKNVHKDNHFQQITRDILSNIIFLPEELWNRILGNSNMWCKR